MYYRYDFYISTDEDVEIKFDYLTYQSEFKRIGFCENLEDVWNFVKKIEVVPEMKGTELVESFLKDILDNKLMGKCQRGNIVIEWDVQEISEVHYLSNITSNVSLPLKMLKLMEEVGEASQALLKLEGQYNASNSASDFLEELADISIVLEDIINRVDPEKKVFEQIRSKKIQKWKSRIKK